MIKLIAPYNLSGRVTLPDSKSIAHRALICAYLAGGDAGIMTSPPDCDDTRVTDAAMRALCSAVPNDLKNDLKNSGLKISAGESGSTLRFLIPVAAALGVNVTFARHGKLPSRPLTVYEECLPAHGVTLMNGIVSASDDDLQVRGTLRGKRFELAGDTSSQFITGLLLALPIAGGGEIFLTSPLQSKPYVDITVAVMRDFGVEVENRGYSVFRVAAGQKYCLPAQKYTVEKDMSAASFWLAAQDIITDCDIIIDGLPAVSVQGDSAVRDIVLRKITDIRVTDIPDAVPILAVWLCKYGGVLRDCGRLRIKESDRLAAMSAELLKFGVRVSIADNADGTTDLFVPKTDPDGASDTIKLCSWNDHRIAMSCAVAALYFGKTCVIDGHECAAKSYPNFWENLKNIGVRREEN